MHINTAKHKKAICVTAGSSSLRSFLGATKLIARNSSELQLEVLFCATVLHNHSFRSMDCISKLRQIIVEDKFACACSKAKTIFVYASAPHVRDMLQSDLRKATFVSVMTHASNHKETKIFPVLPSDTYFD